MMRLKKWLIEKYLPEWSRQELAEENARLREEISALRHRLDSREAYIRGMETALRAMRKVTIQNEVKGIERDRRSAELQ